MDERDERAWVITAEVAAVLHAYLRLDDALGRRELSAAARVDAKTLRNTLNCRSPLTRRGTAAALLRAAGLDDELDVLEENLVIPA